MQEDDALAFYERLTQGTENYKTIELEEDSGHTLSDVRMHPIDKKTLAGVIERLPNEMFEAVDGAEDADEAEEHIEEGDGDLSAVTEETVDAFEDLVAESLDHEKLTDGQMKHVAQSLDFETLFELGTEIINLSVENTGDIRGFREQE